MMRQHYHNEYNLCYLEFIILAYITFTNKVHTYKLQTDFQDKTMQKKDNKIAGIKLSIATISTMTDISFMFVNRRHTRSQKIMCIYNDLKEYIIRGWQFNRNELRP